MTAASTMGWRDHGLLAVEMESSVLFYLALRATGRGSNRVEAACILTVSDGLEGDAEGPQRYLDDQELEAATDVMHAVALEGLTSSS